MNDLERFLGAMEYKAMDRLPNWETYAWPQTQDRWISEGLDPGKMHWDWSCGEEALDMDPREYIRFDGGPVPPFEERVIEEDDRTITVQTPRGPIRRSLKEGTVRGSRMSMDQFVGFPVASIEDWQVLKKRY